MAGRFSTPERTPETTENAVQISGGEIKGQETPDVGPLICTIRAL
jgi:hypothetical protein